MTRRNSLRYSSVSDIDELRTAVDRLEREATTPLRLLAISREVDVAEDMRKDVPSSDSTLKRALVSAGIPAIGRAVRLCDGGNRLVAAGDLADRTVFGAVGMFLRDLSICREEIAEIRRQLAEGRIVLLHKQAADTPRQTISNSRQQRMPATL